MELPEDARTLLALPPDRFVAERDALARSLAERGDRAAAEVRKLRRPLGLAWLLNRLARERRGDVEALLRAGDRLAQGHRRAMSGGGPGELRQAEDELRVRARALRGEAAKALEAAGKRTDPAVLSRLELLLRLLAPAAGPDREAFRAGVLAVEPRPASGAAGLAAVTDGASWEPPRGRAGKGAPAASPGSPGSAPAGTARREAARQAREAKRAEGEAARRSKEARRWAERAEAEVRKAEAEAGRADEAARRAAERARELRARADAARAEAARRRRALDATHSK
jgi:hypothetical protein